MNSSGGLRVNSPAEISPATAPQRRRTKAYIPPAPSKATTISSPRMPSTGELSVNSENRAAG